MNIYNINKYHLNIFRFLTIQTLILYILMLFNKDSIPVYIRNAIINMILTTSISGIILFYMNSEKYIQKTNLNKGTLIFFDTITHVIPLIYCLYTIKDYYKKPILLISIIIQYIYFGLYVIFTDIQRLYFGISYIQLFGLPLIINNCIRYILDNII